MGGKTMSEAYKCDRCGEYTDRAVRITWGEWIFVSRHLCPACGEALDAFMNMCKGEEVGSDD